jgi:hypothetical protein
LSQSGFTGHRLFIPRVRHDVCFCEGFRMPAA